MSRDYDGKTHGIVNENAEMRSNRRLRVRVGLGVADHAETAPRARRVRL